jgi:Protein of unknown function (DUF2844)
MKIKIYSLLLAFGLSAAIFATADRVLAALGESTDSVKADREALSTVRNAVTVRNGYAVHEIESDSTAVREYVSPSGIIFAIAWNGLVHPELTHLLGSYASEYQRALKQTPRQPDRRRLQVKSDGVVVEKWGHMRNLQGRAYVPALIPPGVSVDEIE